MVAVITGLILIVAGLDVALALPASARVLRRPGTVVAAADNADHINTAASEVVIEAELAKSGLSGAGRTPNVRITGR